MSPHDKGSLATKASLSGTKPHLLAVARPWLSVAVVVAAGLAITIVAFLTAQRAEEHRVVKGLEFRVDWRATDLRTKITLAREALLATAIRANADLDFAAAEFQRFTSDAVAGNKSIASIAWVTAVKREQRAKFEAETGFPIVENDADGKSFIAPQRDEYTPVLRQIRFDGLPPAPGLDLSWEPGRRRAMEAARDSGFPNAVIAPGTVASGNPTYVTFWPIYDTDGPPEKLDDRRTHLRGYVTGVFRVVDVLKSAVADTPDAAASINFYLSSDSSGIGGDNAPQLVATFSPDDRIVRPAHAPAPTPAATYTFTRSFDVKGQQWRCDFFYSPAAVAAQRSVGPLAVLLAGSLLTTVLAAYVIGGVRQVSVVRTLVGRQTVELRQTNTKLEALIDASPYAIVCLDAERRVILWNAGAERLFGYPAEEVFGQPYPLILPDERDEFEARFRRLAAGEVLRNLASHRRHRDGTAIDTSSSAAAFYDTEGGLLGIIFAIEDMRERTLVQDQLRQAQKMEAIGNLTGGMAHDFNNLLGVIIGNLDMVRKRVAGDPDVSELVAESFDAAWRGADLTRRLLAFARRQPLEPRHIELNTLVGGMVKLLGRVLGEDVEISLDLASDLWPVVADPAQLEASIANLATNARDAMPNGGRLMIATANRHLDAEYAAAHAEVAVGDYAVIEVSDNGIGMSAEVMNRIFEPFYTTKELGKGTGLGLSMVFGFMKQSGGHVAVYSEPGVGTTFRLYLPRTFDAALGEEIAPLPGLPLGAGETVLVVEDNPSLRRVVIRQLESLGYRTIETENATNALACLETDEVDLVFTDVVMPGPLDGVGLARQVLARWPDIKIILTSGFADNKIDGSIGSKTSSTRLLSKPYAIEDLARILRDVLDGA